MPVGAAVEPKRRRRHIAAMSTKPNDPSGTAPEEAADKPPREQPARPKEIGGPKGPEPTRYGDWQYNGRCTDF
jgi:hypothetical protein